MDPIELMQTNERLARHRKGQTLAEFALTLPILLILVFGIIEFGRIFQAWVTLQNAARAATRYATTGQYDSTRYNIDAIVPCVQGDQRGTHGFYVPDPTVDPSYKIDYYSGGSESLFATWYDGQDCDPGNDDHQERRKDILRLVSIMDEARRGAAGLSLEPNPITGDATSVKNALYSIWDRPLPRSSQQSWFNVMICSSRPKFDVGSTTIDPNDQTTRFVTILKADDVPGAASTWGYPAPYCMMNEIEPAVNNATNNAGIRWLDAGGPGDRINVVITFNHPLITPLGLAPYIQMQARRAAVNESFRASKAVGTIQGSSPLGPGFDTPTPLPPTETPTPTDTPSRTPTNPPATHTPTASPIPPFDCSLIHVSDVSFFMNRMYIQVTNDNVQDTSLLRVQLNWQTVSDYPNMYLAFMSLNSEAFWQGQDAAPNTDSLSQLDAGGPPPMGDIPTADRTIAGYGAVSTWEGVYNNGPSSLALYMSPWTFSGTTFHFSNPTGGANCVIQLYLPPVPSATPTPVGFKTPTATPATCANNSFSIDFVSFDPFGVVRLRLTNTSGLVRPLYGMNVIWIQRAAGVLRLDKVTVGGSNPDDPLSVTVWRGGPGGVGGDTAPNSNSTVASDGVWVQNYTIPPNSSTVVFLDFGGTSSTLASAFGVTPSDFNGSTFSVGCGNTGGNNGPGQGNGGPIFLNNQPTPAPTNTPKPTNTPGPTLTPSKTFTPAPPTKTPTKAPPTTTSTPKPATKTPTPTDVPIGLPSPIGHSD